MAPILANRYVLAVPDADATARFFCDVFGFRTSFRIEGQWHFVERDGCMVMLGSCLDALPPAKIGDHSYFAYWRVDDVDALHAEFAARGLQTKAPEDKPWGMREFVLRTPDGHRITVGRATDASR